MTDQNNPLMIPGNAAPEPAPAESLTRNAFDMRMALGGATQESITLDRLTEQTNAANEEFARFMQPGETMEQAADRIASTPDNTGSDPARLALNKAAAMQRSLKWEIDSAARRPDPNASTTSVLDPEAQLRSVRDNELEAESIRMARSKNIPQWKALELIQIRIKADGIAAVLPRTTATYARLGIAPEDIQIA